MIDGKYVVVLIQVLLVAGAVNWGLIALNDTDLVKRVSPTPDVERVIKGAVGVAGLVAVYQLLFARQ